MKHHNPRKMPDELVIIDYKIFFTKYLLQVKDRKYALSKLKDFVGEFKRVEEFPNESKIRFLHEQRVISFLKENFNSELVDLYQKGIKPKPLNIAKDEESPFFRVIDALSTRYLDVLEAKEKTWNHKKNILTKAINCLQDFGLHQLIFERNANSYKRFNLIISHYYRSTKEIIEARVLMEKQQLQTEFINPYKNQKHIKINGKLIPFIEIHKVSISTTILQDDEIILLAMKNNFVWNEFQKDVNSFVQFCKDETDVYQPNPFEEIQEGKLTNIEKFEEVNQLLLIYPKSHKLLRSVLEKISMPKLERNTLDDLRLCIELLLNQLFNNEKSLENQIENIGKHQKEKGGSKELVNMFNKLIEYYSKYQNSYVKHDDAVNKGEVELILELSLSFIKYLIKGHS